MPVIVTRPTTITVRSGTANFGADFAKLTNEVNIVHDEANTAVLIAQSSYDFANTLSGGSSIDNVARVIANAAFIQANVAYGLANTAFQNTTGTFAGDLTVSGNLYVQGSTVAVNTEIVFQREVIAGVLIANGGISSVNANTGSIVVTGGIGVSDNIYASGIYVNSFLVTTNNITANAITIDGGTY
jgi:hypothetical protein